MKFIICFIVCVYGLNFALTASVKQSDLNDELWNAFKLKYNKVYGSLEEELHRRRVWYENYLYVQEFKKTQHDFTIDINEFADKTSKEMVSGFSSNSKSVQSLDSDSAIKIKAPDSFDWRDRGVIGPVIDQGVLGEAFSIVAEECVQSLYAIQIGKLVDLSIAQIVDCCGNLGDPFQCIQKTMGGLCSTKDYPTPLGKCDKCTPVVPVNGSYAVPKGNEDVMLNTLLFAPLFIGIDASQPSFQLYMNGIYSDKNCSPQQIDHVLQLIGYGVTSDGIKYWICRNSWGAGWGEKGYIRIERGKDMCGIADYALLPFQLKQ